jgi:uncharacterized damage-inducible protein DinB
MDIRTNIQQQIANVHRQIDVVVQGITDEQFNWPPPGTISPVSTILLHLLAGEDYFIQSIIQGKPPCWAVEGWGQKVGITTPPAQGSSWEEFKTIKIQIAPVLDYEQVVRVATDRYLADLTEDELDRRVDFAGKELPVAEVLMTLVVHGASHAGEMAAVKGMQGIKGLPY